MPLDLSRSVTVLTGAGSGIGVSCFCPAGVMTNIMEQITFYRDPQPPRGPNFGVLDSESAVELVVDGVAAGRFLIVTTDEVNDELRERGNDLEAYLDRIVYDDT